MLTLENRIKKILLPALGVILIIISAVDFYSIYHFISTSSRAQGVVIKLNYGGSHPEIQFTTKDKRVIEYPQNGMISSYQVGDKVDVLYQAEQPRDAMIDTFGAKWGFTIAGLFMGVMFVSTPLAFKRGYIA